MDARATTQRVIYYETSDAGTERYIIRKFSTLRKILNLWISGETTSRDTNGRRRRRKEEEEEGGLVSKCLASLSPCPFLPLSPNSSIAITRNRSIQRGGIGFSPNSAKVPSHFSLSLSRSIDPAGNDPRQMTNIIATRARRDYEDESCERYAGKMSRGRGGRRQEKEKEERR